MFSFQDKKQSVFTQKYYKNSSDENTFVQIVTKYICETRLFKRGAQKLSFCWEKLHLIQNPTVILISNPYHFQSFEKPYNGILEALG